MKITERIIAMGIEISRIGHTLPSAMILPDQLD
jgi:hypothetical protein